MKLLSKAMTWDVIKLGNNATLFQVLEIKGFKLVVLIVQVIRIGLPGG